MAETEFSREKIRMMGEAIDDKIADLRTKQTKSFSGDRKLYGTFQAAKDQRDKDIGMLFAMRSALDIILGDIPPRIGLYSEQAFNLFPQEEANQTETTKNPRGYSVGTGNVDAGER
ncbi:MAG: hypothetical protein PHQ59_00945 [Candidatus Daviesbacteria bacterium]|nr:hypothetical protein [Candidatus Daviesbacteria bacterium]